MEIPAITSDSAPESARPGLESARSKYGFVPNLLGVMAHSPQLLNSYLQISEQFSQTSLSPAEQQLVLLSVSRENGCSYCMAAHSVVAQMQGVPDEVVHALRERIPLSDPRLEALRAFTTTVVQSRGWPSQESIEQFLEAGYGETQVFEVILGIGMKTLSNYVNHIAQTPLDDQFAAAAWSSSDERVS